MAGTDKKTSPAVHVTQQMPDTSFDTKALEETTKAMKELQDDFNIYRKEKAENERSDRIICRHMIPLLVVG